MLIVRAIRKYGAKNFRVNLLGEYDTVKRALVSEQYYINKLNCRAPNGYNLTDGGEGVFGLVWTPEMREAQSKRLMGHKGTPWSPEQRSKMIVILGKGKPNLKLRGRRKSPRVRALLSSVLLGKPCHINTRKAVASSNRRRKGMKYRKRLKPIEL